MSETKLSKEQIEALQNCKTKEEVEKFAKDNQLTDEELEKVVGGLVCLQQVYFLQHWGVEAQAGSCYVPLKEDE